MNNKVKIQKIDLFSGIMIDFKDGRDGKVVELNVNGTKKKLSQPEVDELINGLTVAMQWFAK